MQKILIKIDDEVQEIGVSLIFHSKNPKTNQYNVNIITDTQRQFQLFCREDERIHLVEGIQSGSITDLTNYLTRDMEE